MATGIYQLRNKKNNKIYIGSSKNLTRREYVHFYTLNNYSHDNEHLQNSYNKHGVDNFSFEILLLCEEFELLRYEQWFLDNWKPEYNIAKYAFKNPMIGRTHSIETKIKISKANKGKLSGSNNPFFGKTHTEETIKKIIDANTGKIFTQEHKDNISKGQAGKCVGSKNGMSKLIKQDVINIRKLYATKNYTQQTLAETYNVSRPHISDIINYKKWNNVEKIDE